MRTSISARIRRALLGLTLGLCVLFTVLTFLLVYVIEDQVFMNLLKAEKQQFEDVESSDIERWQPSHRQMQLYLSQQELPEQIQSLLGPTDGVYEFFDKDEALFVMAAKRQDTQQRYFILFDVSTLLAVRDSRTTVFSIIAVMALLVIVVTTLLAHRLARTTLQPLKKLTDQLSDEDQAQLPQDFAQDFAGDEIGVLTQELQTAINQLQQAAQREYEFNRGVSHELRSPLQVAQNAVELMALQKPTENNQPLQRLHRSIRDMQRITAAFLWLASERTSHESTDAQAAMANLKQQYQESHPHHTLEFQIEQQLRFSLPSEVFNVIMDNLLRNAVQHGDTGLIECTLDPGHIRVRNPYTDDTTSESGHGVGLVIVRRICEQLGWQLELQRTKQHMNATIGIHQRP